MKQIVLGMVMTLLLFGFFVEHAFAVTGANGGTAGDGTKGGHGGNGGIDTSGKTMNGKNGTSASGGGNWGSPSAGE